MPNPNGTLTPKEQKVVEAYESAPLELGALALDAAVESNRQATERLHQASNAIRDAKRCDRDGH